MWRDARRHGIGLVAEDRKIDGLIPSMSVADNLMLAHWRAVAAAVSEHRQG